MHALSEGVRSLFSFKHLMESVTLSLFCVACNALFMHSSNECKANFLVGIKVLVSSEQLETNLLSNVAQSQMFQKKLGFLHTFAFRALIFTPLD